MSDWWDNMTGVGNMPDISTFVPSPDDFDWEKYFNEQTFSMPLPETGGGTDFLDRLPGYYDEITGDFVVDFNSTTTAADIARGPNARWDQWKYDPTKQTWTDPEGKPYDLSYLTAGKSAWDAIKSVAGKAKDFASSKAGMAGLMGLLSYLDRQKSEPRGGGTTEGYAGYSKPLTRTMVQGKYGPIATHAAQGGLMQAYANGGAVRPFPMQDGGFVMTGDAVENAGGQEGLRRLIPEAEPIVGPGTKTSDSIPAYIQGRNGKTPAKVSNGEAYIPPGRDTKGLYALMHRLERKA